MQTPYFKCRLGNLPPRKSSYSAQSPKVSPRRFVDCNFQVNQTPATIVSTQRTCFDDDEEMANQALIVQLQQLAGQINALQQTFGNLQASNTTLITRIATLEAENTTLTAANMTLTAHVANLSGGAAAGGTAGGGTGTAPLVIFVATLAMVNHQDLINYSTKVGMAIYNKGCDKFTTEFDMKSNGTIVYTTELQAKMHQNRVAHGHPANHQLYQRR
jgi:hypothetical protein